MAWSLFQWGARGLYYDTGLGVYVSHIFIPNCVQINLFGHDVRTDELLHVFHVNSVNALPTLADCEAISLAVAGWIAAGTSFFTGVLNSEIFTDRVVAQSIAEFEGPYSERIAVHGGTRVGTPAPSVLTCNMKKSTGVSGRSHRGYFASWPTVVQDFDSADPNQWDGGYVADLIATYSALQAALDTAGYPMVVASRATGHVTPVTAITNVTGQIRNRHSRAAGIGR